MSLESDISETWDDENNVPPPRSHTAHWWLGVSCGTRLPHVYATIERQKIELRVTAC